MFIATKLKRWFIDYYLPKTKKEWVAKIFDWIMLAVFLLAIYFTAASWREGFASGYQMCLNNFTQNLIHGV